MKRRKSIELYRQGDVLFRRITRLPKGKLTVRETGIVALGEATGHTHRLAAEDRSIAAVLELDLESELRDLSHPSGRLFVCVERSDRDGATFQHEEHGPVTLPPGNFEVVIQREYSPEKIRPVQD